ncbi:MAG: CotH kinase family protein [Proteobacteria bacterium]|nr:CotH kinase family protein [Pseudomonadota bacterium]
MRHLLLIAALSACSTEPLTEFSSEVAVVVVDTAGVEMGRNRSVWNDQYVDATTTVWPAVAGAASTTSAPSYDGLSAIRVRGNSSREYDKRSFRLELRDAAGDDLGAPLLGMSNDADWVLQGPFSDKTLIRNALIYSLSRDIGRYAPRTMPVELFVVDDGRPWGDRHYRGVYQIIERVERHPERVALTDLDPSATSPPDVSGGYLIKRDWVDEDEGLIETPVYRDELLVESPRDVPDHQKQWLRAWLGDFEEALSGPDFATTRAYADFVDEEAFADHMLLVELGRNVDGYVLSTWMHKDRDAKLHMGPIWDYNGALGNADYFEAWGTEGWHFNNPAFPKDNPNGFAWYERMLEDPAYRETVAGRWATHRAGPLSDDALNARIDDLVAELGSGPVQRNFEKWDVLGTYVWPNDEGHETRQSHADEVAYLRQWLLDRAAWMDGAVATIGTGK